MALEVCRTSDRWVDREIVEPVRRRREARERRCRRRPWWHPARWFCEVVIIVQYIVEFVTTIVKVLVTEVVCLVLEVGLILAGLVLNMLQSFPIVGGVIKTVLGFVRWLFGLILGVLALIPEALFGRSTKTLRVHAIILNDGSPLATAAEMEQQIAQANQIFVQCDVSVELIGISISREPNSEDLLDFKGCGNILSFMDQTFGIRSTAYEFKSGEVNYETNWRRFLPFGSYVTVFVVRNIRGTIQGCSNGPFYDFVVVEGGAINFGSASLTNDIVAHELGHACTLLHRKNLNALMFRNNTRTGSNLSSWECFRIRSAPWVTVF